MDTQHLDLRSPGDKSLDRLEYGNGMSPIRCHDRGANAGTSVLVEVVDLPHRDREAPLDLSENGLDDRPLLFE